MSVRISECCHSVYYDRTTMTRLLGDVISYDFGTNHVRQTQVPRLIHLVWLTIRAQGPFKSEDQQETTKVPSNQKTSRRRPRSLQIRRPANLTIITALFLSAADNYYNGQQLGNNTRPISLFCGDGANTTMTRLLGDVLSSDNMLSNFGTNHVRQTQVPWHIHLV